MKNLKKTLLATALIALLICAFSLITSAATYGNLAYSVYNGKVTITDCSYSVTSVIIPSRINGDPVRSIGKDAFEGCGVLESIEIPSGVTSIGSSAFNGCSSLKSVSFGENSQLTSIGSSAFSDCSSLASIEIPSGVTSIGSSAFSDCSSLESVTIGNSVTSIGIYAFYDCDSLESVVIPDSVTSIGDYVFYNCSSLDTVYYRGSSSDWSDISIGSYNGDLTGATRYYNFKVLITYNANGGTGAPPVQVLTSTTAGSVLTTTIPTYTGHTFLGWSTTADGEVQYNPGDTYTQNEDVTLYAVWEIKTYTISYNTNGGSTAPESQTKTYGTDIELSTVIPEKEGYNFQGWSTTADGEVQYNPGDTYTQNEDVTLYAVWQLKTYSVTYKANGGTGAPSSQTKSYFDDLALTTTIPTRTGHTFLGWSTTADGEVQYNPGDTYTQNEDVTLYAVWEIKTYTISYNTNGGSTAPESQTKTYGTDIELSTVIPEKEGYNFLGWSTSSTATSASYSSGATYYDSGDTDVTLYAVWQLKTYSVIYNANGGSSAPSSQTKSYFDDLVLSATIPTRTGHTFLGWSTTADGEVQYNPGDTYTQNEDVTLYAVWEIYKYIISYDANGGTAVPENQIKTHGVNLTLSDAVPEREGYNFLGWRNVNVLTKKSLSVSGLESAHNYANSTNKSWTISSSGAYSIELTFDSRTKLESNFDYLYVYDKNNTQVGKYSGTELAGKTITVQGDKVTLKLTSDYAGTKWGFKVTSAYAIVDEIYEPGESYTVNSDVTLYAVWQLKTYSVTYKANGGSFAPSSQTKEYFDNLVLSSSIPTRTGYTFKGWSTTSDGEVEFHPGDIYTTNEAMTLYAVWELPLSGVCGENVTWSISEDNILTISGNGAMTNFSSSSYVPWYASRSKIVGVVIEESVTSIGKNAFYNCKNLTQINWNAKNVSDFDYEDSVFAYAGQSGNGIDVVFGDGVETIPAYAFCPYQKDSSYTPKIVSITIPDSVTSIGSYAFYECHSLRSVTIGDSVTSISSYAFYDCDSLESVTIPDSVTSIGSYAFADTGLKSITIPNSVTSISNNAFGGCSGLTSITIPNSVTSIGKEAFYNCKNLTQINWNAKNVSDFDYYNYVFGYAGQSGSGINVVFGDGVEKIPAYAFCPYQKDSSYTPKIVSVTIPKSVNIIGSYAFYHFTYLNLSCDNSYAREYFNGNNISVGLIHKYSDWMASTKPTWLKPGVETRICKSCAKTESRVVDVLPYVEATSISLNKSSIILCVSDTVKLVATIYPEDASEQDITWTSSNTDVVTVDENGVVKALAKGSATITATTSNGLSDTCEINAGVPADTVEFTGIKSTSLAVGKSLTLKATVSRTDGKKPQSATIIYEIIEGEEFATIDAKGKLTAKAVGEVVVRATAEFGTEKAYADITINICIPATKVTLNTTKASMIVDGTLELSAIMSPADNSDTITWSVDKEDIATVDENGVVTAHKAGKVKVTAMAGSGKSASCTVTVGKPATKVEFTSLKSTSLALGKSITLKAKAACEGKTKPVSTAVVFEIIEGEDIATIDTKGKLTAKGLGEVTVRARAEAGTDEAFADVTINICIPATKVTLNKTKAAMIVGGEDLYLEASMSPANNTDTLTWSVDKEDIATVDENGVVTAHKVGKVKVTAMTGSGKKATCTVTIGEPATKVVVTALKTTSIAVGKSITLKGKAACEGKTKPVSTAVVFDIIEGDDIATIDAKGKLTAKAEGTVVVRISAEAGTEEAYEDVEIRICNLATKVTLNMTKATIAAGDELQLEAEMTAKGECTDTLTWSVDKPNIATVDEDGLVTAHSAGKVKVTATSGSGKKATCTVTVTK